MTIFEHFAYGVIVAFVVSVICWLFVAFWVGREADDAADRLAEAILRKEEER